MENLIIFGMGQVGKALIKSEIFEELKYKYEEICYYDNNPNTIDTITEIKRCSDISGGNVLITGKYWREMYIECVLKKATVVGILTSMVDGICSYKDLCIKTNSYYENDEMIIFNHNKKNELNINIEKYERTRQLFGNFKEVAIMLSNLCNYAYKHPQCPASKIKEKEILPSKVVYKLLDELSNDGFAGEICFHIYNEPTIDPRLFKFIEYAKLKMPDCTVRLYSNGYYLNEVMIDDYIDIGVGVLNTTGYGKNEYDRLTSYDVAIPYSVLFGNLDERLDFYSEKNKMGNFDIKKCHAFLNQICVYSNGDLGLCCLDYKHPYKLGNVKNETLEKILNNPRVVEVQSKLLMGDRSVCSLCQNCGWSR